MRIIKFRAWSKSSNKMYFQLKESPCFGLFEGDRAASIEDVFFYETQDFEVMQYTGLKDKNGKEIYEGDIVKGKNYGFNNPIRYIGTVEYVYNKFKVIGCRNKYKGTNDELSTIYEVIGNIYENPELLEGEKNE